jgi:hypothetical protein
VAREAVLGREGDYRLMAPSSMSQSVGHSCRFSSLLVDIQSDGDDFGCGCYWNIDYIAQAPLPPGTFIKPSPIVPAATTVLGVWNACLCCSAVLNPTPNRLFTPPDCTVTISANRGFWYGNEIITYTPLCLFYGNNLYAQVYYKNAAGKWMWGWIRCGGGGGPLGPGGVPLPRFESRQKFGPPCRPDSVACASRTLNERTSLRLF